MPTESGSPDEHQLAEAYVLYYGGAKDQQWAFVEVTELVWHHPDRAWPVILEAVALAPNDAVLGNIGASAIEDLFTHHGDMFANRVETEARDNEPFRKALAHAWIQRYVSEDVWEQLRKVYRDLDN